MASKKIEKKHPILDLFNYSKPKPLKDQEKGQFTNHFRLLRISELHLSIANIKHMELLSCPQCKFLLENPFTISKCGDTFCEKCIKSLDSKKCPIEECGVAFTSSDLLPNPGIEKQIAKCEVYCPNRDKGCKRCFCLGSKKSGLIDHLKVCEFSTVQCEWCDKTVLINELREHDNEKKDDHIKFLAWKVRELQLKYGEIVMDGDEYKHDVTYFAPNHYSLANNFKEHSDYITSLCFHPNGTILASCSHDKKIEVWNPDTTFLYQLGSHASAVWGLDFSNSGDLLASGSEDRKVSIWKPNTDRSEWGEIASFKHKDFVNDVSFNYDGSMVASASMDRTIMVNGIENSQNNLIFNESSNELYEVEFGKTEAAKSVLLSAGADGAIRVYDVSRNALVSTKKENGMGIRGLSLSRNGDRFLSGSVDGTVRMWDINSPKSVLTLNDFSTYDGYFHKTKLCWNDLLFAFCSNSGQIRVCDVRGGAGAEHGDNYTFQVLSPPNSNVWSVDITRDGTCIACSGGKNSDYSITVWKSK